jgi:hypothetical protein
MSGVANLGGEPWSLLMDSTRQIQFDGFEPQKKPKNQPQRTQKAQMEILIPVPFCAFCVLCR